MSNELSEKIELIVEILFLVQNQNNLLDLDYWEWELEKHMEGLL